MFLNFVLKEDWAVAEDVWFLTCSDYFEGGESDIIIIIIIMMMMIEGINLWPRWAMTCNMCMV